jgi:hypothetical protein
MNKYPYAQKAKCSAETISPPKCSHTYIFLNGRLHPVPFQTDETYLSYTVIFTLNPRLCGTSSYQKPQVRHQSLTVIFLTHVVCFLALKLLFFGLLLNLVLTPPGVCLQFASNCAASYLYLKTFKLVPLLTVYPLLSSVFLCSCFGDLFLLLKDLFSHFTVNRLIVSPVFQRK